MAHVDRRGFFAAAGAAASSAAGVLLAGCAAGRGGEARTEPFQISLAQWSLHRALKSGAMTNLDFPVATRREYGLGACEFVNEFFGGRSEDAAYLDELRSRCEGEGVRPLLIMCDGAGALGDPSEGGRARAVENHMAWARAAARLGCHSIRVNAQSRGTREEQARLAADGLRRLTERAAELGVNTIVENHGGLSSDGAWLAGVMRLVDHPRCGTLPDFGNFTISAGNAYDRYRGVEELMPFARAVSAKSYDFDAAGEETTIDYGRMLRIVAGAGYRGYVGIEYEGERLPEPEGIRATRALLERVRESLRT